jgi:hypothetical protein
MNKITREQAEKIVASRTSLCCGARMKLKVTGGVISGRNFTAWAECEAKEWMSDRHEAEILGELTH